MLIALQFYPRLCRKNSVASPTPRTLPDFTVSSSAPILLRLLLVASREEFVFAQQILFESSL